MSSNQEESTENAEPELKDKLLDEINNFNIEFEENYTVLSRKVRIIYF